MKKLLVVVLVAVMVVGMVGSASAAYRAGFVTQAMSNESR